MQPASTAICVYISNGCTQASEIIYYSDMCTHTHAVSYVAHGLLHCIDHGCIRVVLWSSAHFLDNVNHVKLVGFLCPCV